MSMIDVGAGYLAAEGLASEDTLPREPRPRSIDGRTVILASPEIRLDDLLKALAALGLGLRATPGGWHLDPIHAFNLVKKDDGAPA